MAASFILMRVAASGFCSIGPTAKLMTLEEAKKELIRLKRDYPYQDFRILGEVGTASRSEEVTVTISNPVHDETPLVWKKRQG